MRQHLRQSRVEPRIPLTVQPYFHSFGALHLAASGKEALHAVRAVIHELIPIGDIVCAESHSSRLGS